MGLYDYNAQRPNRRTTRTYRYNPQTGEIWAAWERPLPCGGTDANELQVPTNRVSMSNIYRRLHMGIYEFAVLSHYKAIRAAQSNTGWELTLRLSEPTTRYFVQIVEDDKIDYCPHVHEKAGGAYTCKFRLEAPGIVTSVVELTV